MLCNFIIILGLVTSTSDLFQKLQKIWFTEFSRTKNIIGSSGFEHVFVGEINEDKMEISGLHNWIMTYKLESDRTVNYQGYMKSDKTVSNYDHLLLGHLLLDHPLLEYLLLEHLLLDNFCTAQWLFSSIKNLISLMFTQGEK